MEGNNNECGICLETYNESSNRPLVLPCTHSFCQSCLMKLEESNSKKCSICRCTWNDTKVKDLLCCIQLVPSASANATKKDVVKCSEHEAEASSWCTSCDEAVCVRCLRIPKHRGCTWILLEEQEYDAAVKKLDDIVSRNKRAFNDMDRLMEQLLLDRDAVTVWQNKAQSLLADCPRVEMESGTDFSSTNLHEKIQSLTELTAQEPASDYANLACFIRYNRPSISSSSRHAGFVPTSPASKILRPSYHSMSSSESSDERSSSRSPHLRRSRRSLFAYTSRVA